MPDHENIYERFERCQKVWVVVCPCAQTSQTILLTWHFTEFQEKKARQSNHLFNCFTVQSSGVFRGKVAPGISSCLRGFSFVPLTPDITELNTSFLANWQHFETFVYNNILCSPKRSHNSARVYPCPRPPLVLQVSYGATHWRHKFQNGGAREICAKLITNS